jgi:amino acid adenylation domain-containing protein
MVALRLTGDLNVEALRFALYDVAVRHESLRTVFPTVDGTPYQHILDADEVQIPLSVEHIERSQVNEVLRAAGRFSFDLTTDVPLRSWLFTVDANEHVFTLVLNHIAGDGWSLAPLMDDLTAAYTARVDGNDPQWTPLPVQYADYALWQRGILGDDTDSAQLDYWRQQLRDLPDQLDLPTDRPRRAMASIEGNILVVELDPQLYRRLAEFARSEHVTLFMLCHAALATLLTRLGAGTDIPIGSPIAGRTDETLDNLIGFFVNTLVIRTNTTGNPTFHDLLNQVRTTVLAAFNNQDIPFERLVETLNPQRSLSRHPLFQTMLAVQNNTQPQLQLPDVAAERMGNITDTEITKFDLSFSITERADGAQCLVEYGTDLFDRDTVRRIVDMLMRLLDQIVDHPDRELEQIDLLSADMRHRILTSWNDSDHPAAPTGATAHQRFAEQVARTPDAIAVVSDIDQLTFTELDRRANRLAHRLIGLGVGTETPAAVFLQRSVEVVVSMLAILKAGGTYVPLHTSYPPARLQQVLADSRSAVLITDKVTRNVPIIHSGHTVQVEDPTLLLEMDSDPGIGGHPDQLAYVMYTSGSSGEPKGVAISHRALLTLAFDRCFDRDHASTILFHAPYAFDVSNYEIWVPLLTGKRMVVAPPGDLDGTGLQRLIRKHGVNGALLTAGLFRVLAEENVNCFAGMTEVLSGGDIVPAPAVHRLLEHHPDIMFQHLYGPTEISLCGVQRKVHAKDGFGAKVPMGRAMDNRQAYVLDRNLQPVPVGVAGELYMAGAGLARGYLNRTDLTAERFIANPFADDGTRMYRTGDLVCWTANGELEFIGRADHQVKIRGFRIEPAEIETVLAERSDIREAVVTVHGDGDDKRLVAYVVRDQDELPLDDSEKQHQVDEWQGLYDTMYTDVLDASFGQHFSGWNSSIDGAPIPLEEMRQWRQHTVEAILEHQPRNILEIGVGSGLILAELAPHCEQYWATDFSPQAIRGLQAHVDQHPDIAAKVRLRTQAADVVDGLPAGLFDTVVINSVTQYFPNPEYLTTVLRQALDLVIDGGRVFVGDVRNLHLLRHFHTTVQAHRLPDADIATLTGTIERAILLEKELLIAPEYFTALRPVMPEIGAIDVRVKPGTYVNELSRYRYDVTLHKNISSTPASDGDPWTNLDDLTQQLQHQPEQLRVRTIPNTRLTSDADTPAAEEFHTLGREHGYQVITTWDGDNGDLQALFTHDQHPDLTTPVHNPPASYVNNPAASRTLTSWRDELRAAVADRLPDYMVPAAFIPLTRLPVTPNGKLDHRALPTPEFTATSNGRVAETAQQQILCDLFADLLGVPTPGIDDSFFDLGGHSLLATRLVSRIRAQLGVELNVRAIFENPTIAALAQRLPAGGDTRPALTPQPRPNRLPLSYAQQRLWFLHQMGGDALNYNSPLTLRLTGPLDQDALRAAITDVVARHETLRTVFPDTNGQPHQRILEPGAATLHVEDVPESELDSALAAVVARGFDLATEPPLRAHLLVLGPDYHVLALVMHHIATDGWSLGPLARDLTTAYAARTAENAPHWTPLPVQYADYTLWQHNLLGTAEDPQSLLNTQLNHWRETLRDLPTELALPTDRHRTATPTYRGDTAHVRIEPELHQQLINLARNTNTTLFMVLQAAFAALLTKLGAGTDIPLGTVTAGRTDDALDDLVGFFVNTVVLRNNTAGNPTFHELLNRVRDTDLAAYAHQDLPFELLVDTVKPERSAARHPLFQTMIILQNNEAPDYELDGLRITSHPISTRSARFDLTVHLIEDAGDAGIHGVVHYSIDLYDRATVDRILNYYRQFLLAVAADPASRLGDIDILTTEERHRLIAANGAVVDGTVVDLFERRVAAAPQATALITDSAEITYAELNGRVNQLARRLVSTGVGPETTVAIALPRSTEYVIAALAVLKAGGAYLPIDPDNPQHRTSAILADSSPHLTIADLKETEAPEQPVTNPSLTIHLDNAAYTLYTSGSTGTPKGVTIPHRAIATQLSAMATAHGTTADDRVLHKTPTGFDVSVWEILGTLTSGATLVIAPPVAHRDPAQLAELIRRHRVTTVHFVPSMLREFLREPAIGACTSLRTVISGGEALPADLAQQFREHVDAHLHNRYGPTETTVAVSAWPCDSDKVAIGRPFPGTQAYVLDADLRHLPDGVTGELYVAGPCLGRGYTTPAATADRFVANPYGGTGSRMYRTGDLVRRQEDGTLRHIGRIDHQVKLRGLRIELGEIDSALAECTGVTQAVTVLREDGPGGSHLVSYVVSDREVDVQAFLSERLPSHMVPTAIVPMPDGLPLSVNGKVDRGRLPAARFGGGATAPRTPGEHLLRDLFAEVLGVADIGVEDDFFALGGHSLLVTRLVASIRERTALSVSVRDLFDTPTVAGLAARLVTTRAATGDSIAPAMEVVLPLRAGGARTPLFCVHPVSGLGWSYSALLAHLDPELPVYALQARGIAGVESLPADIEEMAADYLTHLRSIQPAGPYRLLGWSFGGVVAHAIAARLRAAGERVELLALLDAYPLAGISEVPSAGAMRLLVDEGGLLDHLSGEQVRTLTGVVENNSRILRAHTPPEYDGEILFFSATRGRPAGLTPDLWRTRVDNRDLDCGHFELLATAAADIAAAITAAAG